MLNTGRLSPLSHDSCGYTTPARPREAQGRALVTEPRRPNVVVILPDQLRPDFLGCYGGAAVATPHIDALAAAGVRFDSAVSASPVCVPARTALLTGMNAIRTGVLHNLHALRPDHRELGVLTWSERLADAGYNTAAVGKMHLYPWDLTLGFGYRSIAEDKRWIEIRDAYYWFLRDHGLAKTHAREHPDYISGLGAYTNPIPWELSVDHFVGSSARKFLRRARGDERPFALFIGFPGPHDPYDPDQAFLESVVTSKLPVPIKSSNDLAPLIKARNIEGNKLPWCGIDYSNLSLDGAQRLRLHYAALVAQIDFEVGEIVTELRNDQKVWDNTVIIFTSDHGDYLGDHGMVGKESFFETAIRIPLIMKPAVDTPGSINDHQVELSDVAASILALASLEGNARMDALPLPGITAGSAVRGAVIGALHDGWMVRTRQWKLHKYATGEMLLFDLEADPDETRDLFNAARHRRTRDELDALLTQEVMRSIENAMEDRLVAGTDDLWNSVIFGHQGWTRRYPYSPPARWKKEPIVPSATP